MSNKKTDKPMTSAELVDEIATRAGDNTSSYQVRKILGLLADVVAENAKDGRATKITGIGTVNVKQVPERKARNIQTGEEILVAPHNTVRIAVTKKLKDAVH